MKINKRRAQVSMEFIGITTLMFGVFVVFMAILSVKMSEVQNDNNWQLLIDYSKVIEDELRIASGLEDGYIRTFELLPRIQGKSYEVNLYAYDGIRRNSTYIYIRYINFSLDTNYSVKLPKNIRGKIYIGTNNITKNNGIVCINNASCA